jgi:hypothetical protein
MMWTSFSKEFVGGLATWDKQSDQNLKTLKMHKTYEKMMSTLKTEWKIVYVGGWVFTIFYSQWSFGGLGIWTWFISRLFMHM